MLRTGAWIGFTNGDTHLEMVVCCSDDCVQKLLTE